MIRKGKIKMEKMTIDYSNMKQMIDLMNRHNEFDTMIVGENSDGERVYTSINEDKIGRASCRERV